MTDDERLAALEELAQLKGVLPPPPKESGLEKIAAFAKKAWGTSGNAGVGDVVRGGANAGNAGLSALLSLSPLTSVIKQSVAQKAGASPSTQVKAAFEQTIPGEASRGEAIKNALPVPPGRSQSTQYAQAGLESLGGMAALGPNFLMNSPKAAITSALTGGLASKAGGDYAKSISPDFEDYGKAFGGFVGGGLPALFFGRDTSANATMGRAARSLKPSDFAEAEKNVDAFSRSGSSTSTLPELFPGRTSLLGLAEKVRGDKGGEELASRTQNRAADVSNLGQRFLDNISPEVNPNTVANRSSAAAETVRGNLNNLKNEGFRNRIAGETVPPQMVQNYLIEALLRRANAEERDAPRAAYRELARSLKNEGGKPITSVPELSKELHSFGVKAADGSLMNPGGGNISSNDTKIPLAFAKKRLGQISQPFEEALTDAREFNQQVRAPFSESPVNAIADRNPNNAYPTPASRLNKVTSGNTPDEAGRVLKTLSSDPGLPVGKKVDPLEIVRALMQGKLEGLPTNPGQAVRGQGSSVLERQLAEMLTVGGKNPKAVMEPLNVADNLQNFQGLPGMGAPPNQNLGSALIRPFRSADFFLSDRARTSRNQEIAKLFSNPSRENLMKLRQLAANDPEIAAMLRTFQGTAAPVLSQENQ